MSTALAVPAWLERLRATGAASFERTGLPTQRQEAWKYTGLNRLKGLGFEPSPSRPAVGPLPLPLTRARDSEIPSPVLREREGPAEREVEGVRFQASHRLVFVDGHFDGARSSLGAVPDGVVLGTLATLLQQRPELLESHLGSLADVGRSPMIALNTGWMADGLVLIVPPGVEIAEPIELICEAGEGSVAYPRHLISLGDNASATLVEHHVGSGFADSVAEITLGSGARLGHPVVHRQAVDAFAVENVVVRVARDAAYRGFGLIAGGALVRRDIQVRLDGPGAFAQADGAYLVDGERHADTTIFIDHAAPHCQSRQTQKGVIDDRGRAVFQGKILVRPDAQKTDGAQLSQTLLLSPQAEIDVKPELEIHADDVKCSHGATVGRLDANALFFLRARGIPEPEARALLIQGFIGGALDEIAHAGVREAFAEIAETWLKGHSSPESTL